jgi:hypothetical protein
MGHTCLKGDRNSWGPGCDSMKKERQNQWLQVSKNSWNSWGPGCNSMKKERQNHWQSLTNRTGTVGDQVKFL